MGNNPSRLLIASEVAPFEFGAREIITFDKDFGRKPRVRRLTRNRSGVERENALLWAMNLRSWFISKMGSRSGNLVLDKEIILRWFIEGLTLSVQAAREKAARIGDGLARVKDSSDAKEMQSVGDDLGQLRRIKLRLNVAKVLVDCGELARDPELDEWLEIRGQLP